MASDWSEARKKRRRANVVDKGRERHRTTPNSDSFFATITALFLFILGKEGKGGKRYDTTAAASKSIELQF